MGRTMLSGRLTWIAPLALTQLMLTSAPAWAQKNPDPPAEEAAGEEAATPSESPTGEAPTEGQDQATPSEQAKKEDAKIGWKEIVVAPRRVMLKRKRVEIMPTYNVSLNSPMIRHHGVGGQMNVWLSEALFLGVEGTYYIPQVLDRYYLLGLNQRILPSVNKYIFSVFLEFGYVPIYGKFNLFNKVVAHWEAYISGGLGILQSEIIPREPGNAPFQNILIGGLLPGFGLRLTVTRWFSLDTYIKTYIFADKLEPNVRTKDDCTAAMCPAKDNAVSQITANVVFGLGLSFFLPPKFEYKTAR